MPPPLPGDWGDTLLVDPESTIKIDDVPTLREHCVALSYAMIGVGDTAATRIKLKTQQAVVEASRKWKAGAAGAAGACQAARVGSGVSCQK
jgi:hypothetical protein